jgi:hypothetical protein
MWRRQHGEEPRGGPSKLDTPTAWVLENSGVEVLRGGGHGKRSKARSRVEKGRNEAWRLPSTLRQWIRATRERMGRTWTLRGQVACVAAAAGAVGT